MYAIPVHLDYLLMRSIYSVITLRITNSPESNFKITGNKLQQRRSTRVN